MNININGQDFKIDENLIKDLFNDSVKSIASGAFASAVMCLVSEIIFNGVFAKKSTEVRIDGDLPANIMTLGGKNNPKAVYISNKKRSLNLAPAFLFALTSLAAVLYLGKVDKEKGDTVIL